MKRLLDWLISRRAPRVLDLPQQFGPRLRLSEVRAMLLNPQNRALLHAVAQLLWMRRVAAQDDAMSAALDGKTPPAFPLGQMSGMDNVLADLQHLMAETLRDGRGNAVPWKATETLERWFLAE